MPSVSFRGFEEFGEKLKRLPAILQEELEVEVRESGRHWADLAKNAAPVDQGRLRNEIRSYSKTALTSEVVVNVEYAPFIEWGTKTKVSVPADMSEYAAQFKGKGTKGSRFQLQKLLFAWMNRVGIKPENQWIVYITIITKGIKPHPFFFIQKPIIEKEFFRNVKAILNSID